MKKTRNIAKKAFMRTRRILHLIDFIKLAEKVSGNQSSPPTVRVRHPDEEVRVAPWNDAYRQSSGYGIHNRSQGEP